MKIVKQYSNYNYYSYSSPRLTIDNSFITLESKSLRRKYLIRQSWFKYKITI